MTSSSINTLEGGLSMEPRLTIALPTYNRARLLEGQLNWLASALKEVADPVEILLSDNCSTDDTASIIERWRRTFPGRPVQVQCHESNLGPIRNIVSCIRRAGGSHVWVISDDDTIHDEAPLYVLQMLRQAPDLAFLGLNFSARLIRSGQLLYERCFNIDDESVRSNGQTVFERCLRPRNWGGLALTSAIVYRTDLAREALNSWPDGPENEMFQLYVGAYCARRGPAVITKKPYLECNCGDHYFLKDPLTFFKMRSADISETFSRIARDGYSPRLLLRKIVERPGAFLPMLPGCLLRSPRFVLLMQWRYLLALASVTATAVRAAWASRTPAKHSQPRADP